MIVLPARRSRVKAKQIAHERSEKIGLASYENVSKRVLCNGFMSRAHNPIDGVSCNIKLMIFSVFYGMVVVRGFQRGLYTKCLQSVTNRINQTTFASIG